MHPMESEWMAWEEGRVGEGWGAEKWRCGVGFVVCGV
jgi:hypothetical protein